MPDGYVGDVLFRHIPSEQMEQSRKIIEIGAIGTTRHRVDPALERGGAAMLNKIEEVERYLRAECGDCDGALRGCETIREALTKMEDGLPVQRGL